MLSLRSRAFSGVVVAVLMTAVAGAGSANPGTRDQIVAAVSAIQAAVEGGQSAARVAELLYTDDIVIVGEGARPAVRGRRAALKEMEEHWASLGPGGVQRCKLSLSDDLGVGSAETYASFFVLRCAPGSASAEKVEDVRGIYVWKKTPHGWRVALEQWGIGKL